MRHCTIIEALITSRKVVQYIFHLTVATFFYYSVEIEQETTMGLHYGRKAVANRQTNKTNRIP